MRDFLVLKCRFDSGCRHHARRGRSTVGFFQTHPLPNVFEGPQQSPPGSESSDTFRFQSSIVENNDCFPSHAIETLCVLVEAKSS